MGPACDQVTITKLKSLYLDWSLTTEPCVAESEKKKKDNLAEKMKRLLRVDSDDTEELHNKFRETAKDREEKIRLFEEQLNIKVRRF